MASFAVTTIKATNGHKSIVVGGIVGPQGQSTSGSGHGKWKMRTTKRLREWMSPMTSPSTVAGYLYSRTRTPHLTIAGHIRLVESDQPSLYTITLNPTSLPWNAKTYFINTLLMSAPSTAHNHLMITPSHDILMLHNNSGTSYPFPDALMTLP